VDVLEALDLYFLVAFKLSESIIYKNFRNELAKTKWM